ncbi:MAG: zf-HC2 domain-containing protein [Phycisphaerae bacterium]|nr:zf-HC2 domain-containing protein [Phycisphaerae bacterium]
MNCAECRELLVVGLEGLLDDTQKQAVVDHLKTCKACRAEFKGLQTLRQRLVGNGKALAQSSLEDEVMNRIIREQNVRLKSAAQAGVGLHLRRLIMKSSATKMAVAAAVVLAAIGGTFLWTGTKSGVALADVLAKVEQIQAFMYKATMHVKGSTPGMPPGGMDMEMTMLIANEYGMKMEMSSSDPRLGQAMTQQMYMLPQQRTIMVLMPSMKKYMRMEVDDEMFEKKRKENNDPRLMLKKILECQYTDLGKTTLDGIEVQGFQTTDPAYAGGMGDVDVKVWVNMKTELPVRVDMKIKMNEQMEMEGTLHDFQWDVPVSAAEFDPVIPADFTAGPGDGMKMPAMTEGTAIGGLKLCAESAGKYPEGLDLMTLMQMPQSFKDSQTQAAQQIGKDLAEAKTAEKRTKKMDEQVKKMIDAMMPLQSLGGFYMTLVQEKKEPAYYGRVVKPGDAAQVLLRWKTAENEYRVIFGDLHAITVDADTLAKLEAALPK